MIKLKIKDEATRLVPEESIALIKPWGYGSKDSLIKAKADKICHTPIELQQFFIE